MDFFAFANWGLLTVLAVTLLWPLNVGLLILAHRVALAGKPSPFEGGMFWFRYAFGSLGLFGLALLTLGLLWYLVVQMELTGGARGGVVLTLFLLYLPAAIAYLFWILEMEEPVQAVQVFLLFVLLPGLPLLLVGWLIGLWKWLAANAPWLLS